MTKSEAIEAFMRGSPVMVVEYRGTVGETIRWRGKQGEALSASVASHSVEFNGTQLKVSEELPPGANASDVKSLHKKGANVILHFQTLERVSGSFRARGTLEPLQA